ncbi:MAG: transposase [Leptospirales bacterium]|nr:transposase [Leptospirales bacterium]
MSKRLRTSKRLRSIQRRARSSKRPAKKTISKRLRQIQQGVTYHCFSRCQGFNDLLLYPEAKIAFTEATEMSQNKYEFELGAVEIVGNHFHIVIRTLENGATIDRIMQYIKARTAEKYNKATGRKGPFWNERYKCKIVEHSDNPEEYLPRLKWYIALNPVRKGLSDNPRNNYIGFINCYLIEGYEAPVKITLHPFFYKLGNTFAECAEKFLEYEKEYLQRELITYS